MLLGNDRSGAQRNPERISQPKPSRKRERTEIKSKIGSAVAVRTRAGSWKGTDYRVDIRDEETQIEKEKTSDRKKEALNPSKSHILHRELIREQRSDEGLASLWNHKERATEVPSSSRHFCKNRMLTRKWSPHKKYFKWDDVKVVLAMEIRPEIPDGVDSRKELGTINQPLRSGRIWHKVNF